jgi:hypothetical protein
VSFPYESFYWARIDLKPGYGQQRFKVSVHPNMAKVIDLATSETLSIFTGEDRKALAVLDATARIEYWDRHSACCWSNPKPRTVHETVEAEPELLVEAAPDAPTQKPRRKRTRRRR